MAKRKPIPSKLRDELLIEARHRCCLCPDHPVITNAHHVIEVKAGGPNTQENLVLVCGTCHDYIHRIPNLYTPSQLHEYKRRWIEYCWPRNDSQLESDLPTAPYAPIVSLAKLPLTGPDLFGRDRELSLLDQSWEDPHTNIVAFIAFGGVGKSALVNQWLRRRAQDGWCDARRVFGWSFYSQGQREHTVSADLFIDAALRFFGDPNPNEGSPWDKGQRLATLVNQQPTILALDGIEPLQSTIEDGKINDPALDTLLRELAYGMNGLCLLTSRVDFPNLPLSDVIWGRAPDSDHSPALRVSLERLSTEAGRHLLRQAGVKGLDGELDAAVEEYEGHALALVLLGEYLAKFLDADIAKRDLIPPFPDRTRAGRHAFRVMEAYDRALAKDGMEAERAILRIVGLFDRPADKGCLEALRQPPAIESVSDSIVGMTDRQWRESVGTLRQLRLLSPPTDQEHGSLDAHPLVREWFGQKLGQESPEGFRQAHSRLYEHLRDHGKPTRDTRRDTIQEMIPLFHAIRHGCLSHRHKRALDEIFWPRIRRESEHFSVNQLGAWAADLDTLACFFEDGWRRLHPSLGSKDCAELIGEAGFDLSSLGRVEEAAHAMTVSMHMHCQAGQWSDARQHAENLAVLYVGLGRLKDARSEAQRSVHIAKQAVQSWLSASTACLGEVLHRQGLLAEASTQFRLACDAQVAAAPFLYSLRGAQYAAFLIDVGRAEDVMSEALSLLQWFKESGSRALLDVGLEYLKLGCAFHAALMKESGTPLAFKVGGPSLAGDDLNLAVEHIRLAGRRQHAPRALLARAFFHRDFGDRDQAERDLREALDLSTRFGLRLHETDARLLQGQMALDEGSPDIDTAQTSLARAEELVTETGYHLRDADILILEGRLLSKKGDNATGRAKLNEAITVARREEKDGCVYQVAVDQATRYLNDLT